ncbi:MAG: hypothetical protein IJ524_05485 [Bacteroidales bacterium]|nr:hypothetical protein [Bacteroidales bacterium]
MKAQTSTVVYEFTNEVYPYSVFIGIGVSDLTVRKLFMRFDDRTGRSTPFKIWENSLRGVGAGCQVVRLVVSSQIAYFININPNVNANAELIAHEACHAADWICNRCGVKYGLHDEGEAHAYLVGMVARFMEQVITHQVPKTVKKWTPTVVNHIFDAEIEEDIRTGRLKYDENGKLVPTDKE